MLRVESSAIRFYNGDYLEVDTERVRTITLEIWMQVAIEKKIGLAK